MPDWINTFDSKFEPIMTTLLLWSIGPDPSGPRYWTTISNHVFWFGQKIFFFKNGFLTRISCNNWMFDNVLQINFFKLFLIFIMIFSKFSRTQSIWVWWTTTKWCLLDNFNSWVSRKSNQIHLLLPQLIYFIKFDEFWWIRWLENWTLN